MSVSNVSGSSSSLFEFLQALQKQNQPANTSAAATTGTDTDAQGAQAASSHHHHHGGGGSGSSLISKIEGAVTTALQSATPGSDPNKTIQDAIAKALGSGDTTTASDPTATAANTAQPDQSAFVQLLQTYGVTQQQFQQDIQSALAQAQQNGGPLDFSKIFGSFPPGTNVDTTV